MCGLPVSPVPLATFWTQSLEEREEVWERTKWIWETRLRGRPTSEVCVQIMIIRDSLRGKTSSSASQVFPIWRLTSDRTQCS